MNLARADLELVSDKAGGGSRSCAQIARNEADVLAYEAAEENRRRAGENVVAVLGAKIDAQGARIEAEIKAQPARIDVLQRVI